MPELLPLGSMARRAGVTQRWLREQADAGTVPCLRAGQCRYLFLPSVVMEVLAALATQASEMPVKEGVAG